MRPSSLPLAVTALLVLDAPVLAQTPVPAAPPSPPSVRWTGYIQVHETYRDGVGLTGSINRARLTAYGTLKDVI